MGPPQLVGPFCAWPQVASLPSRLDLMIAPPFAGHVCNAPMSRPAVGPLQYLTAPGRAVSIIWSASIALTSARNRRKQGGDLGDDPAPYQQGLFACADPRTWLIECQLEQSIVCRWATANIATSLLDSSAPVRRNSELSARSPTKSSIKA